MRALLKTRTRNEAPLAVHDPAEASPEVAAFLESANAVRRERAYYLDQCEHLTKELRLEQERNRRLEAELADVERKYDFYRGHSIDLTTSLSQILVQIKAAQERSERAGLAQIEQREQAEQAAEQDQLAAVDAALNQPQQQAAE